MRKFGGSSEGLCPRCKCVTGDCHCVRNASRHVNHKEESARDSRDVDDIIRDIEDNNYEFFTRRLFHIN